MEKSEMIEPMLIEIAQGWSAHGDGWAVHGATREEAIAKYWEAARRRQEILAMPPWYKQVEAHSQKGGYS